MPPERIGILGGTFDPVHLGHLIPAMYAVGHLGLERLYLVPSAAPVHRPLHEPAPAEDRLRMCELAAGNLARFRVSDVEVRRAEPSYTVLTLEHFRKTLGPAIDLVLLLGEDNLPLLHTWHRAADLPRLARLAILPRSPRSPSTFSRDPKGSACSGAGRPPPQSVIPSAAEGSRRDALPSFPVSGLRVPGSDMVPIPSPLVPISASAIRQRLRAGGDAAGLLPASVAAYIRTHSLYRP